MRCTVVRIMAPVRCGAVRCGAVRCGAVRCGAVRCGAVVRPSGGGHPMGAVRTVAVPAANYAMERRTRWAPAGAGWAARA